MCARERRDITNSSAPTRREFVGYTAGGLAGFGAISGLLSAMGAPHGSDTSVRADERVGYQYFHTPWSEIEADIDRVADAGIDLLWVPQPAQSKLRWEDQATADQEGFYESEHPHYGHLEPHPPLGYQPIDLRDFDSEYGTREELESMIETAHDHGIEVVLDTVLNHMANSPGPLGPVEFPQFEDEHFHDYGTLGGDCQLDQPAAEYECDLLGLPTLDVEHPEVQAAHRDYLRALAATGADGLRYDAAKHIWPWYFDEEINPLAADLGLWRVGEVWSDDVDELLEFADTGMTVFDFPLHSAIVSAFDGGRMEQLSKSNGQGVVHHRPDVAVTFAQNHDINGPGVGPDSPEGIEIELAHAYLLSYPGLPMLFRADLDDDGLQDLIWVKQQLAEGEAIDRHLDADSYVFERDGNLLAGINTGTEPLEVTVETSWRDQRLTDYTNHGPDRNVDSDGTVSLEVRAQEWVMYAPPGQR
ncbi:alpha-amylase family glycosyl hydrolase [Natrialbaceae archaeon A-CW2]